MPHLTKLTIFHGLVLVYSLGQMATGAPKDDPTHVRDARIIETPELGIPNPTGLAFSPRADTLLVVELPIPPEPSGTSDIELITHAGERAGTVRIAVGITHPVNTTYDSKANRLLIFQTNSHELIEILARPDGSLDPTTLNLIDARPFGLQDPKGLTVDPASGHLFILDAAGPRIVRVEPDPQQGFESAITSEIDLAQTGLSDLRGLAFDPTDGHLHLLNPEAEELYELNETGQIVVTRDLSEFKFRNTQGMTFASRGDLTDDPSPMSLYIADRGVGPSLGQSGQISELSLVQTAAAPAATGSASLVQTIDTSLFSPPSPDPSGCTYGAQGDNPRMKLGQVLHAKVRNSPYAQAR